jgi:hypothetical protein
MAIGIRTIGVLYFLGSCLFAASPGHPALTGDQILAKAAESAAHRRSVLREYSGTRHYTVSNRRFNKEATGTVRMLYREEKGADLQVMATAGSDRLAGVIRRVTDSEEELSRDPGRAQADVSPRNYSARLVGREFAAGRPCYVLALTPRVRSKHLIQGKAWIDEETYSLIRIEGQFAASVSAFLGRPYFTQEFTNVGGYWLPLRATATSSSFLLGLSELKVEYLEYELGSERYQPSQTYAENWRANRR